MSVLGKKRLRELRTQPALFVAVTTVMALGVLLFVASAGAYRDLRDSYADTQARLALAGVHVELARPLTGEERARVDALEGVALSETRRVAELPVVPEAGRRAALRVLSLPDEGTPRLDQVLVLEGALPAQGEVLLEKHFARHHGLGTGASLPRGPGEAPLRVSGVAVSAEYLWVARSQNDFFTSPDEFGVGWMREASLAAAAASVPVHEQLLVQPRPPLEPAQLLPALRAALSPGPFTSATPRGELVGIKLLQLDVDGYKGMAAFFPLFFLGVGAFIMGSLLARLVDAQRALIGTLLALGVSRGVVLRHYLGTALLVGGGGALLGALAGVAAAPAMTHAYAQELNIPFVSAGLHLDLLLEGVGLGAAVALLAGLSSSLRAMRLHPAEAMRPARPTVSGPARWLRRLPAPLPVRLALRDVFDRPLRSLGTALGVACAVLLVLSTGVLMDSMRGTFDALFTGAQRYDARVDFGAPVELARAAAAARAVPGVSVVEPLLSSPVRLEAHGHAVDALLQALDEGATLVQSVDADGTPVPPHAGALVLTRTAARKLGLAIGDEVRVTSLGAASPSPCAWAGSRTRPWATWRARAGPTSIRQRSWPGSPPRW